jgi:3D (Asp-Asp-Asp) domain-containing protein
VRPIGFVAAALCMALVPAVLAAGPRPKGARSMRMTATAYCQHGTTQSGEQTRRGIIAADPRVLPVGSVVRIESPDSTYSGTYTVMDTGAKVKGRIVDIFVPSCAKARKFGKRLVIAKVLEPAVR